MDCICIFAASAGATDWPAWIQAVGSVAGIFTAVGLAWWQQLLAKRQTEDRLMREKVALYVRAHRIFERFQKLIKQQSDDATKVIRSMGNGSLSAQPIPPEVRELERDLHLLSEAGGPAFTAINLFEEAQELLKDGQLYVSDHQRFMPLINFSGEACAQALKRMRNFIGKL